MMGSIDDAHRAGADLFVELVRSQFLRSDRRFASLLAETADSQRKDEDGDGTCDQEHIQHAKGAPENRQRAKGLGRIDFGGHSQSILGHPFPRTHDENPSIVAVSVDIDARFSLDRTGSHLRQRHLSSTDFRPIPARHVPLWVTNLDVKYRASMLLVGKDSQQDQIPIEPAVGDHPPGLIECVRLPRTTKPPQL